MKANPGGQIALTEVLGREQLISQIWDTLEHQSIRINAERRIGKTTVIRKLHGEPRDGWATIFQDLERCHSAEDFAQTVYRGVETQLSKRKQVARRTRELLKALGGTEIGGILKLPPGASALPWQDILTNAVRDLVESCGDASDRVLFLWDEVPWMLQKVSDRDGEAAAMEVLDVLRELRQTLGSGGLRMVLTGSIGLHHVIGKLKRGGYANSPVNDTFAMEVPALAGADARDLAQRLLQGEGISTEEPDATATAIANAADDFPFYIHHIVKALKLSGGPATPQRIGTIVSAQMTDPNDPWELNHYRERIPIYYGSDNEAAVLDVLDGAALHGPRAVVDLLAELKATGSLDDRERLLQLLRLMEQDHYLKRGTDGRFAFRFELLCSWWRLTRGL